MTCHHLPQPLVHRALRPVVLVFVLLLPVFLGWAAAHAQGTSVEELERRLQKAKEEKARRDAAAAKAAAERKRGEADAAKVREAAEAERRRNEAEASRAAAERRAREGHQATLVVQADAPCMLKVNGRETAQLLMGITEVKVSPGQILVSCASVEEQARFEGELEVRSGQSTVLGIALAGKVAEIRSARAAALERASQASREAEARAAEARRQAEERARAEEARLERERREAEKKRLAIAAMNTRLRVVSSEVLFDSELGLQWTRSSNERNVGWAEAQSYCRGLGQGWSLPTVDKLMSLYVWELPESPCGPVDCRVSNKFSLRTHFHWSSEPSGPMRAWTVNLADYRRHAQDVDHRFLTRALCVRRP